MLKPASREPDGGLRFLEQKLSGYVQGASGQPAQRRNPALDLLTGRLPDQRVQTRVGLAASPIQPAAPASRTPQTLVIPMAAVALAPRPGAFAVAAPAHRANSSPWLQPSTTAAAVPRIRFDEGAPRGNATWPLSRWLLAPLAAGLVLAAGVGLVRGLSQSDETIVVPSPSILARPELPTKTEASGTAARPSADSAGARVPAAAGDIEPAQARPQPTTAAAGPVPSDQLSVLLDERFGSDNARGWTNDPSGVAWLADGAYHLFPRQSARFVAVSVPGTQDLTDVVVSGHFRKTGGPAGGGYGLIVRDQASAKRGDGQSQVGAFYVFEVGDKGELGVWLREDEHWVDLLPWTASDAIHPGQEANDLTVSAIGDRLSFLVNGVPVAAQLDTLLHHGGVAIFTGGDGNQVSLERLTVRTPR